MKEEQTQRPELQPVSLTVWKKVFKRLPQRFSENHILIVAGGIAFYFFLSVFPALAAVVSIYGLLTDPGEVQQQMSHLASVLPGEAGEIIQKRLNALVEESPGTLEWQLVAGTLLSIWITNVGTRAVFRGINIAYGAQEGRGFWREIGLTILFTIGGILFYIVALAVMLAYPAMADELTFGGFINDFLNWIKWPLFAIILCGALTLIYHFAPVGHRPRYRRILWGAGFATIFWILGSWLLSLGVGLVGVAPSYGPLAAVAILMLWFLLSSFVILLGAEINSELEQLAAEA